MKVTKQLQVRSITHYAFELDPQIKIQPEQLKTIVDTIIQYGNPPRVSIISILGDDDGSFSLDFDSFDKLYAYVKTHNMWDVDTFVLHHEYYSDVLNFGFSFWTNQMNVGFSNFEPEEVLRLVERIEAALLDNDVGKKEAPSVAAAPSDSTPRFTQEQLDILRSFLVKHNLADGFRFSEEKIHHYESEFICGALDGSGMDTTEITITPIHLSGFDLKDLRPGFCLTNRKLIFRRFAGCVQGDAESQIWSVSRERFFRFNDEGHYETVDISDSMAVRNPMGIGVDILITYERCYYLD